MDPEMIMQRCFGGFRNLVEQLESKGSLNRIELEWAIINLEQMAQGIKSELTPPVMEGPPNDS